MNKEEKQLHKGQYSKMSKETLRAILNHSIDHDCRCTDPESSCNVCYRAWEELELNRKEENHHYV